jgi:gliding motility-associated-like protein
LQQLNSTIQGCGYLLDPPGGILPAGAECILFTSTQVSPSNNSLVNLQDTLYAVFQCNASTSTPYFPNYSTSTTPQTLIVGFNIPGGCGDTVSYQTNLLLNFAGQPGPGNGARVDFSWSGTASYHNDGCFGPFPPLRAVAGPDQTVCVGDSAFLFGSVASSFGHQWSGGAGTFVNRDSLAAVYVPAPGELGAVNLFLSAVSSCDTVFDTLTVFVINGVVVNLGPDLNICTGGNAVLDAGFPGSQFAWSTGDTTQSLVVTAGGAYSVTVTNACGSDADTVVVIESAGPIVDAGVDLSSCITNTVVLNATVSSGTVSWTTSGGGLFSAPTNSLTDYNAAPSDTGTVWMFLEVSDLCGVIRDTLAVTFYPELTGTLSASADSLCQGDTLWLSYSGNADSIRWFGGTGFFVDDTLANAAYVPAASETGLVQFFATFGNFCGVRTDTLSGFVREQLVADFSYVPAAVYVGSQVDFSNFSTGNIASYQWSFGDLATSTLLHPSHVYGQSGSYPVQLIVSGPPACPDTAVQTVVVENDSLFLPNVFSPNGDGINDVFQFRVPPSQGFALNIYDRWGNLVHTSLDPNQKWDGRNAQGEALAEGVYYYAIQVVGLEDVVIDKTGWVTLVR